MNPYRLLLATCATLLLTACNHTDEMLQHKKWRVYDVQVPPEDAYNITQVNQAKEFKSGYYSNAYYQFLDNHLFIATINNKPDSGRYTLLSGDKVISITASNGSRKSEHLVTITRLDADHFDMKVQSEDFQFILLTKKSDH
ncbi:hypothetical protein GA0116948_109138 [Chitinophaga costaii]|uniref:Lipocalin-like domain-containing protein n=1 Tax=Chitinophaga costaii TaxID=1335309 RepID=A0A1C4ERI0_9BACT|nr:hypothetical protein [Chitinophaga costaii]SCC46123.1 hypothetical protein GA0116948_109138 [Chitinophaga costaii]